MTNAQIKEHVYQMDKFAWAFNEAKRAGTFMFSLPERQELNQRYFEIFGAFNNIHCDSCLIQWTSILIDWYYEKKQMLLNTQL